MLFETIFFDLDATLYDADNSLWSTIGERIEVFMHLKMGLPSNQVEYLKYKYYEMYGTTLRGLQLHHGVDPQEYLTFVHDIPVSDHIGPDENLRNTLCHLPQAKWVFTNADSSHSLRVLDALGIRDCFEDILSVERMKFHCKPHPIVYKRALEISGQEDPTKIVYLDDSPRNLEPAKGLGFYTILVGTERPHPSANTSILRPHNLVDALPQLLEDSAWS